MKFKTILPLFGIVCTILACNPLLIPSLMNHRQSKVIDVHTVSQAQFDMWTAAWDSMGSNYSDTALVKYYTMPVVDLAAVLGREATIVRFYQGLK